MEQKDVRAEDPCLSDAISQKPLKDSGRDWTRKNCSQAVDFDAYSADLHSLPTGRRDPKLVVCRPSTIERYRASG
jgi:hypothetical protein